MYQKANKGYLWVAKFQVLLIFSFALLLFSEASASMMELERKLCDEKERLINYQDCHAHGKMNAGRGTEIAQRAHKAFHACPHSLWLPPTSGTLATHRRSPLEAVLPSVGHRKFALPNVGIMLAFRLQFVAPGEKSVRRDTGISLSYRHRLLD